jgi:tetratricopeptide (TPR) repeat protein
MKRISLAALLVFVLIFALMTTVQAQSPQQTLNQYIADLQKSPNDNVLREKIIKHVQTMKPKPAIPEEVQKYMDRGIAAIESAKTAEDFQDAAAEFMKAVTAAPWLGNGYRNLVIAQDKAGQYDAALKNLQLYLLTRPSSSDEAWAKTLMNKVEYRKEKVAKESSPAAIASKKSQEFDDWLKKLDGARYTRSFWDDDSRTTITYAIDIKGKTLVETTNAFARRQWGEISSFEIPAREFVRRNGNYNDKYTISEETIIEISNLGGGDWESTLVYRRVR